MKLVSWNVNGLRAVITKGFEEFFKKINADIFCIQETKMQEEQIEEYVEIGPGKTLTGFVKKEDKEAKTYNINNLESLENFLAEHKN